MNARNPRTRGARAALVAVLGFSSALLPATDFPFNATSSGTFTADDSGAPIVTVHIDHPTVIAPGFDFASVVIDQVVDISGVPFPFEADFTFTGVGGDLLMGGYRGLLSPGANPGELLGTGLFEFTGGTGLFAGATGQGTLEALVQFTGPNSGLSTIHWDGRLNVVPEPAHGGLAAGAVLALATVGWSRWRRGASGHRAAGAAV